MRPANPPSPAANPTVLHPRNLSFIRCLPQKLALSPRGITVSGLSSFPKTTGGQDILSNALRRLRYPESSGGGFSLGIDLGASHTGLALGKGFCPRPLTVLDLRGQKLETRLLEIADLEEVDEFIIGLPRSHDGKENPQSNKIRSIAGRIAVQAAERGWRVYLQDEYGTTQEALDVMIERGLKRSARQRKIDAYSALMLLERYFSTSGIEAELVLPKQLVLQEKLRSYIHQDNLDF